jgi:hypothetical protein
MAESDFIHSGITSTGPTCMVAALMQLERHGWGNHVVGRERVIMKFILAVLLQVTFVI